MLRQLGSGKIHYLQEKIVLSYHCINGAGHQGACCVSCWNNHPNIEMHLPQLSTQMATERYERWKER